MTSRPLDASKVDGPARPVAREADTSSPPRRAGVGSSTSDERPATSDVPVAMAVVLGALLIIALAAIHFYGASNAPLTEPDEARYAELGREMLESGDWITPHLNYVKYFEKPPLVYWATAASFAALGVNELAARLPSLISGFATIALTVALAAQMYGVSTALLTLPIIAVGPLFGFMTENLVLDMSLTVFMTLTMVAVWRGFGAAPGRSRAWYRLGYAALAGAVLVKGPVAALLAAASAVLFLALHGGWRAVRPLFDWRGAVLALALVVPWFIAVSWRNPEFVHFFVVEQHIARYLWTTEHGEPIWFFLPVLPLALAPFGLALLFDPMLLRAALAPRSWSVPTRFLVIWVGVIVCFFSLSTSKLLTYVLPALPPLAILTARALLLGIAEGRTAGLARVAWLFLLGGPVMSLCGVILPMAALHWRIELLSPALLAGGPVLMAMGWSTRLFLNRGRPLAALVALSVGWLAVFAIAVAGRGIANNYRYLAQAVRAVAGPEDRVALYGSFTQSIGFYNARRVIMIGSCGELRFGSLQGDQRRWFWPVDALHGEWAAPGRLFLIINRKDFDALDPPLDPPPRIVAQQRHKLLVVNR